MRGGRRSQRTDPQTQVAGRRSRLASPATAATLAILVLLLAAAVIPLSVLARQGVLANAIQLITGLPLCAVGFAGASRATRSAGCCCSRGRRPAQPQRRGLCGAGIPAGPPPAVWPGGCLAVTCLHPGPVRGVPAGVPALPDGMLPSPRWRWVLRSYLAIAGALAAAAYADVISIIAHGIQIDASGGLAALDHPSGSMAWVSKIGVVEVPVLAFWVMFAGRLVLSWRRSSGDRRQQLKWLMSGSAIAVTCAVIGNLVPALDQVATPVGVGMVLPACLGIAILRYRLYDIDRIISRTLAYAIVTGLLVGVYAGLVLLATQVLTIKSPIAVAGSTLVAAALFSPLRSRVQRAVDRRFNRARYDADTTVAAFVARLKDAMDLDAVQADLASVVQRALEPAHVSVWMNKRG